MRWTLLLFFVLTGLSQGLSQGIEFFHGTWEEALEQAQIQDKVIFVDAYTTWCGPCKRMAKTVFTQEAVGEFYNEHFINMKIDMEKPDGRKFQIKYPVSAYPTFYYIDGEGEVVYQTKGGRQAEQFIELGRTAIGKADNSEEFAAKYNEGDRDPELIYKYVKALNKAGKPSLKISNDYLNSQDDLSTEFNLRFIYESTIEADSRIFGLMMEHRPAIEALKTKEAVQEKILDACRKTAMKAIEFESPDLHEEAKDKMKKHYPEKAAEFAATMDMNYYRVKGDAKGYLDVCTNYVKKQVKNDASGLYKVSKEILTSFSDDSKAMKYAEKIAKKAAENGGLYRYYYNYAEILLANGKKSEAIEMANKSLKIAEGEENAKRAIQGLIQKIERS